MSCTDESKYIFFNSINIRSQNELVATAVLTLALYLRFDWDTKDFIRLLEAEFLWTGCYLLMASCAMTMFASVVGCCTIGQARPNLIAMVSAAYQFAKAWSFTTHPLLIRFMPFHECLFDFSHYKKISIHAQSRVCFDFDLVLALQVPIINSDCTGLR